MDFNASMVIIATNHGKRLAVAIAKTTDQALNRHYFDVSDASMCLMLGL